MPEYEKFIFKDLPSQDVVNRKAEYCATDALGKKIIDDAVARHLSDIVCDNDSEQQESEIIKPEPVDLEQIKKESYALGFADAEAAISPSLEKAKENHELAELIGAKLKDITPLNDITSEVTKLATSLLTNIAEKLYLVLEVDFEQILLKEISTIIKKYYKEGKITVRVHAEKVDYCTNLLQSGNLFGNKVDIVVDEDLSKNDCVVEWESTRLEYSQERLMEDVNHILAQLRNI